MILVTGAGGKTGRAITKALLKRGAEVRGIEIMEKNAEKLRALGVEVVMGDMYNVTDLTRAAEGIQAKCVPNSQETAPESRFDTFSPSILLSLRS